MGWSVNSIKESNQSSVISKQKQMASDKGRVARGKTKESDQWSSEQWSEKGKWRVVSGEKEKRSNRSSVISISEKSKSERMLGKQKKGESEQRSGGFYWLLIPDHWLLFILFRSEWIGEGGNWGGGACPLRPIHARCIGSRGDQFLDSIGLWFTSTK